MIGFFDKIFRTRMRIHYSWLGVIVFMTLSVATQFATSLSLVRRIVLGLIASLVYRNRLLNTRQLAGGMKAALRRLVNKYKLRKLNRPVIKSAWVYEGPNMLYMT